jgi:hypothetical protein
MYLILITEQNFRFYLKKLYSEIKEERAGALMGLKGIRGVVTETSPFSDSKPYNLKRRFLLGLDLRVFPQLSATGKCARYAF